MAVTKSTNVLPLFVTRRRSLLLRNCYSLSTYTMLVAFLSPCISAGTRFDSQFRDFLKSDSFQINQTTRSTWRQRSFQTKPHLSHNTALPDALRALNRISASGNIFALFAHCLHRFMSETSLVFPARQFLDAPNLRANLIHLLQLCRNTFVNYVPFTIYWQQFVCFIFGCCTV